MRELALCFLGPWQATFAAESPPDFKYDKVRALLAYLAVEADRPHRREALLGMLWPEMPEAAARNNLRQVLATLRKALGERPGEPPFLLASRATVQLNPEASWRLDVAAYMALIESGQQH